MINLKQTGLHFLAMLVLALGSGAVPQSASAAPVDCEPARCAAQDALAMRCPCDAATNHGKHVSCVNRVLKDLVRDGTVPTSCKGKVTRCAARSTCGKSGFVTCYFPDELGTCDLALGTCVEDASLACTDSSQCVLSLTCRTRSSAESCTAVGGISGGGGSCCGSCG